MTLKANFDDLSAISPLFHFYDVPRFRNGKHLIIRDTRLPILTFFLFAQQRMERLTPSPLWMESTLSIIESRPVENTRKRVLRSDGPLASNIAPGRWPALKSWPSSEGR